MKISKDLIRSALEQQTEKLIKQELKKWLPSFKKSVMNSVHDVAHDYDVKKMVKKEMIRMIQHDGIFEILSLDDYRKLKSIMGRALFKGLRSN